MTGLQALVLAAIALTGGCSTLCPLADTEEVPELADPPAALGDHGEPALANQTEPLEATAPSLTALLTRLTETHLPGDADEPLLTDLDPEPSPTQTPESPDASDPQAPEAEADRLEAHAPRQPADEPAAEGQTRHAAPDRPAVQGQAVAHEGAAIAASLLLGLAAVGLYHKLTKDRALDHPARQRILAMLEEDPGLGTTDVADRLDVCYRTARHHLEVLARFDLVARDKVRGAWRWARPEDAGALREPEVPQIQQRMLALLDEDPGLHLSEIARRLEVAKATVKLHLDRLDERDRVRDERVGPLRRFFPEDPPSGSSP